MQSMSPDRFARIAKALSDPTRFEILECVARKREVPCKGVCECFPVSQATVSHHLKELATAGIVETRRDGQFVYYRVRPGVLDEYLAELERRLRVFRSFEGAPLALMADEAVA